MSFLSFSVEKDYFLPNPHLKFSYFYSQWQKTFSLSMLHIFYLNWSLKAPENKSRWSSLWTLWNSLASIIFHFATTYSCKWTVQLGTVKKKILNGKSNYICSYQYLNIWAFCTKCNDNHVLQDTFHFRGILKLLLCQQHSFFSLESIEYCPEGMCSLPQSNVEKQIGHTLKKASQASQMHIVAHVRQMNGWLQDCFHVFPDARLSIGYQPMWCGECNLLLHSDCWFKNRLLNISYSLEPWGRLP